MNGQIKVNLFAMNSKNQKEKNYDFNSSKVYS